MFFWAKQRERARDLYPVAIYQFFDDFSSAEKDRFCDVHKMLGPYLPTALYIMDFRI